MENDEGKGGTAGSSRWNPTKEQISVLENMYKQGIRTPSADQIQQITGRLRAYGHIEGKNVFYWFQNHKARQRQKQKHDSIAYFNRLLHKTSRFFYPPPCSNVVCGGPHYLQQQQGDYCNGGFTQPHKVLIPGGYRKRTITDHHQKKPDHIASTLSGSARFDRFALHDHRDSPHCPEGIPVNSHDDSAVTPQKTLPLFPLQPSDTPPFGRHDVAGGDNDGFAPRPYSPAALSGGAGGEPPYFDFFSGSGGSGDVGDVL